MKKSNEKLLLKITSALSVIAALISVYLLKDHYSTGSSICDFSSTISCSAVNSSIYSEIFSIPVALLGIVWALYLIYFVKKSEDNKDFYLALYGWSILGLASVLYFVLAEFMLQALCPFCTIVHVIVLVNLGIFYKLYKDHKKNISWARLKKKIGGSIMLLLVLTILLFVVFNLPSSSDYDLDSFAECIASKEVNMYGSFRCGHCANQRELFGDSFDKYITEIECHPDGENSQAELCIEKEIPGTPTWINEPAGVEIDRHVGSMTLEELAEFSGCTLE